MVWFAWGELRSAMLAAFAIASYRRSRLVALLLAPIIPAPVAPVAHAFCVLQFVLALVFQPHGDWQNTPAFHLMT